VAVFRGGWWRPAQPASGSYEIQTSWFSHVATAFSAGILIWKEKAMIKFHQPTPDQSLIKAAEQSHHAWNVEQEAKDVEAAAALYTEDATLESPLTSNR